MPKNPETTALPRLRFPEFQGEEWSLERFETLYTTKRNNSFSRERLNYEMGKVRNIHYGDIHTKFSMLFDIESEIVPYINESVAISHIKKEDYCIEGDVIFADASEDLQDIGKCIEIINTRSEKIISGLHTILARQKGSFLVKGFAGYLFSSPFVRAEIQFIAQGTKVLGLSSNQLNKIQIPITFHKKEQQKIADTLSTLDDLIATETTRLQTYQTHKKGLMQALFPAEGETLPQLRFPEFEGDGEWEETLLGDVAENLDYRRVPITESQRVKGHIPYYGASGIIDYVQNSIFNESLLCVSEDGANLLTRSFPIAFSISGPSWVNNHAHVLRFPTNWTQKIVENYLNFTSLEPYLTGMAQPKLNRAKLDIIRLLLPLLPEQQKIANTLSSLDDLISAQTQKIEALQLQKKGLMQGLFPEPSDL